MKFDFKKVGVLLDEMESILGRVKRINSEFQVALDAKKPEKKKAA